MILKMKTLLWYATSAIVLAACSANPGETAGTEIEAPHQSEAEEIEEDSEIVLSEIAAQAAGIRVDRARIGRLGETLNLPAEVKFDADRVAKVSPQISGVVKRFYATEGDRVDRGNRLALLASRELADLKSDYLSAESSADLAQSTLAREEALWADRITSEADLLEARAAYSAANSSLRAIENKLQAVGVSAARLRSEENGANFLVTTPISGVVLQRSVSIGEAVSTEDASAEPLFMIVDSSVVWVDLAVFKQDVSYLGMGTPVRLTSEDGELLAEAEIAFLSPIVDETSRTATARLIVENADGALRPGRFLRAQIDIGKSVSVIRIPEEAVQLVNATPSVFVPTNDGFEPLPVVTGLKADGYIGITRGLREGQAYVSQGAFTLKSQLEKDSFGGDDD